MQNKSPLVKILIAYYGLLQSLHLLTLARAGLLILGGNPAPFPILPPPGGWSPQAMAFLYGLAGTDVIGILLGIVFAVLWVVKNRRRPRLGRLSLAIFITGALVFAAGTFPAGAWAAHPAPYGVMVLLFIPAAVLFILLLGRPGKTQPAP
jgi:hypothetical protein